jgi:hypothetical protein
MTETARTHNVIGSGTAMTLPARSVDRPVARPNDLPGIVIFSHGVNDPGASYESVEEGLCQGLNDRLNRSDMIKGEYGVVYKQAKAEAAKGKKGSQTDVLADPDTYLYARSGEKSHSVFIPFYWGYRAEDKDIPRTKRPINPRNCVRSIRMFAAIGSTLISARQAECLTMRPQASRTCTVKDGSLVG